MARKLLTALIAAAAILSGVFFWSPLSRSTNISAWCNDRGTIEDSPNYAEISTSLQSINQSSNIQLSVFSQRGELSHPGVLVSSKLNGSANGFEIVVRDDHSVFVLVPNRSTGTPITFEVGKFPTDSLNQELEFRIKNGTILQSLINGRTETSINYSPLNPYIDIGHISGSRLIIPKAEVKVCISTESRTHAGTMFDLASRVLLATALFLLFVSFSLKLVGTTSTAVQFGTRIRFLIKSLDAISFPKLLLLTALSLPLLVLPNVSRLTQTQNLNISLPIVDKSDNPFSQSTPSAQIVQFKNRTMLHVLAELSSLRDLNRSTDVIVWGSSSRDQHQIAKFSFALEGQQKNEMILTVELASNLPAFKYSGATFRSKVPKGVSTVLLEVSENRHVTASQGGKQFFSYSFGKSVFQTEDARYISVVNNPRGSVTTRLYGLTGNGARDFLLGLKTLLSICLLLACLFVFSKRLRHRILIQEPAPTTTLFASAAILGSSALTFVTFIFWKFFSTERTFYSGNGLQLSAFAQFSDFYELSRISQVEFPYSLLHSNYPPFAIWVFRLGISVFSDNALWLGLAIAFVPGVLVSLLVFPTRPKLAVSSLLALTVFCYPVLFALDRGNPDLIMPTLIMAFLIFLIAERPKTAALFLGIAIAFKIYPIVFFLLLIRRNKSVLSIFISASTALFSSLIASVFLGEKGLSEIPKYIMELRSQNNLMNVQPFLSGFNSSMTAWWHSVEYFLGGDIGFSTQVNNLAGLVVPIISAGLLLSLTFWTVMKKRPISLVYMITLQAILLIIDLSADYRLGLFVPAILLLVLDVENSSISRRTFRCEIFVVFFFLSSHPLMFLSNTPLSIGHLFNAPVLLGSTILVLTMHHVDSKLDAQPHPSEVP